MRFCGNCGKRLSLDSDIGQGDSSGTTARSHPPTQLGVLVGSDLAERLHKAGIDARGQRRNVTVLFADLCGYTALSAHLDEEDLFELVQKYIHALASAVYKYEGIIDKLTGDGLMALFGAPIAFENNAERAVRAALEMQTCVRALSLDTQSALGTEIKMRVGLHSGTVIVGGISSNQLMDYTAIGDTVNLAHRIEEAAAPGSVMVSTSVYNQTGALFNYSPGMALNLKGISQPVIAYQVLSEKEHPGFMRGIAGLSTPMVGRDKELELLEQVIVDLSRHKRGAFVHITGEAGIGKSRLVGELIKKLPAGITLMQGKSLAYRRTVPYSIFTNLLRRVLGASTNTPDTQLGMLLGEHLQLIAGNRAPEILPYLEHLLSLPYSDPGSAERIRYLDASQLRQQLFLAFRTYLSVAARHSPLLLVLDDLHWVDEASLDLLKFVSDTIRAEALVIIAISRPIQEGPLQKFQEWASRVLKKRYYHLAVKSLSDDQSELLLSLLLSIKSFPPALRSQIIQRAAGVPFYLEEILRMLIDKGLFKRTNQQWVFEPSVAWESLGVPETLQELILARMDRLTPAERHILQISAVIGNSFNLTLLKSIIPYDYLDQFETTIKTLNMRGFIIPHTDGNEEDYAFRHLLVSETIYNTILRRERQRLHGLIGAAIEKLYHEHLDDYVELLARHYGWSPQLERALYYSILAGQKASRGYLNDQAREHFEHALKLLSKVEASHVQKRQIHTGLGDVFLLQGEYLVARQHFFEALKTFCEEDLSAEGIQISKLHRKISATYERQGDYEQSLAQIAKAQQILANLDNPPLIEQAQILNDIGWIDLQRGRVDEAETKLTKALSLATRGTQYDVISSIYNRLGGIYFQKGQLDLASYYVRKSLVIREELGDTLGVARSYNNLGLLGWRKGDWDQALDNFTRSLELHASLGDIEGLIQLHSNIGLLQTDRGDLEEAKKHLTEGLQMAQQIGHGFLEGLGYMHMSRYWLAAAEWKKSTENCELALAIFEELDAQENIAALYTAMGVATKEQGELDKASEYSEKARAIIEMQIVDLPSPEKGRNLRLRGEIARLQKRFGEARDLLEESTAQFTSLNDQLELGRTLLARAKLAGDIGEHTESRVHLREARLIFRQLGAKLDLHKVNGLSVK